tara:strand:+ start:111 stop:719 length:609 start_codon:yes stop_codon:yes gene_type:complete
MIQGFIVNPVKRKGKKMPAPKRRRRRGTRKGQVRRTARRAFMKKSNPVRRRKARRKNPAGDIVQDAVIAGAFGAAICGVFEMLKTNKAKEVARTGDPKAGVPNFMVEGYGEPAVMAGAGIALGLLMDRAKGGSFFKKNAKQAASGIVAVAAAQALKVFYAEQAAKQVPAGALYAASPQAAIAAPNAALNQGVGALYEGALPF